MWGLLSALNQPPETLVLTLFVATDYFYSMANNISARTLGRRVVCSEEIAFLELLRTTDVLSRGLIAILKTWDLSMNQYNVLRILRGSAAGLPCGEIARRMITRDPDITRLLDRLEKRGLIARWRDSTDRRMVMARITREGLKLLVRLDEPVEAAHRSHLGHMGRKRMAMLIELLCASRRELV
jgi:DNA-binding MarR family transcriptional regulator